MDAAGRWPLLAVLAVAAVYAAAVPGAQFVLDDDWLLAPGVPDLGTALSPWWSHPRGTFTWRPLAQSVQWAWSWALGGSAPAMRALVVLMVTVDAGLLAWLARRRGASGAGAGLLALGWGLHGAAPSVACYSSAFFDAAAVACALVAMAAAGSERRGSLGACAAAMLGALLCKETAVAVVPVAALAAAEVSWRRTTVVGAAGAVAAGAWMLAHRAVTGQSGAEVGLDLRTAWTFAHYLGAWLGPSGGGALTRLVAEPGAVEVAAAAFTAWVVGAAWRSGGAGAPLARAGLAWALALVPVAIGAPVIGVVPHRYVPLALALAMPFAAGAARGRLALGLLAVGVALQGPVLLREIRAWQGPAHRWARELDAEPTNPVAEAMAGRWMATRGGSDEARAAGRAHLESAAFAQTAQAQQLYDPVSLRLEVAQLAFLAGERDRATRAITGHFAGMAMRAQPVTPNAWCVRADIAERSGIEVPAEWEVACAAISPPAGPASPGR